MLILGVLFGFVTMMVAFVVMSIRGAGSVSELLGWVVVAGSFVLAGALAPRRRW